MPVPQPAAARLEFLRLIRVAGPDRTPFLQGQLTQDIHQVTATRSALFGWTTAQGRLLLTGQIFEWQDALWLTCPEATAESLLRRLRMFVMRSRVTADLAKLAILGLLGPGSTTVRCPGGSELPPQAQACVAGEPWLATRLAGDPARALLVAAPAVVEAWLAQSGAALTSPDDWLRADIGAGLPVIGADTAEMFLPQMINLDLAGGVSFAKGCYVGQEIITRTRHLGRIKRRMFRFLCADDEPLRPGTHIFAATRDAGLVVSSASTARGQELLAVTQLENLPGPLFADAARTRSLTRLDLPYAIPEADGLPPRT